jgi:hypothetical protein
METHINQVQWYNNTKAETRWQWRNVFVEVEWMKYYFDYELVQKGNMNQWKPVKEEDRYGIGMS